LPIPDFTPTKLESKTEQFLLHSRLIIELVIADGIEFMLMNTVKGDMFVHRVCDQNKVYINIKGARA
jgi:hypothetical protein